jgi:hypothetical protein
LDCSFAHEAALFQLSEDLLLNTSLIPNRQSAKAISGVEQLFDGRILGISIRCVAFPVPSISCTKTGEDDFSPAAREPLDRNAKNAAAVRIETTTLSTNNRSKSIRMADRSKLSKRKL